MSAFHANRLVFRCVLGFCCVALAGTAAVAADVTNPAEVNNLRVDTDGIDNTISWDAVTTDAVGNPETVDHYEVYRGTTPDFVPDKSGGTNRLGSPAVTSFVDSGAGNDGMDYYYLVSAVDTSANEGLTRPSKLTTPPVLNGFWTDTTIEIDWTDAEPAAEVTSYRVYYGNASGVYDFVDDVGLVNSYSLTGLQTNVNWYIAVVGVDGQGNEGGFSNEHIDPVGGTIDLRAHDQGELCWGASKCTPADPDHIQRSDGFQLLVPIDFPDGDWTRVDVTFTMESRLCDGAPYATNRCGDTNPVCRNGTNNGTPCAGDGDCTGGGRCVDTRECIGGSNDGLPCNGGADCPDGSCQGGTWNPCGDPWDRTAHLFMVLDDCIATGGSCITHDNLELLRTITPFGTDAPPPDGRGIVPPRALTFDVTPFAPLMQGQRYIGAHIGHFVPKGWWVTTDFHFSKRPEEISDKPPADGFEMLFFGGANPPTDSVAIPANATQVFTRLFTTGHGGSSFCDGGSNDGQPCDGGCPGGSCQNCDEFCHRTNQILVESSPAWEAVPWRDCCWPRGSLFCEDCQNWNSCGYPSCTFDRAGWCPGEIACHSNLDEGCDQDLDLSSSFAPGGTYNVDYAIPIRNGSWSISLALYWYEN